MSKKLSVFNFNYIDKNLTDESVYMLKNFYKTYHLKCWCYKQLYKSFKIKDLAINISSATLIAVGAAVGTFINPIALASAGLGGILQVLSKKKNYPKKIEQCKFAYANYQKELNALKGYLRGKPFDKSILLFDLNKLDDLVVDQCPIIRDSIRKKYYRKFADCINIETDGPHPTSSVAVDPPTSSVSVEKTDDQHTIYKNKPDPPGESTW